VAIVISGGGEGKVREEAVIIDECGESGRGKFIGSFSNSSSDGTLLEIGLRGGGLHMGADYWLRPEREWAFANKSEGGQTILGGN